MFTTISWSNYLITVCILLFCWYLFLIIKFYLVELKQLLKGEKKMFFPPWRIFTNSNYQNSVALDSVLVEDFDRLSIRLTQAVAESDEENLGLNEFQHYLRFILSEYPFVKKTSLREKVNKIIISECEKYPRLVLTDEGVDSLWEETT